MSRMATFHLAGDESEADRLVLDSPLQTIVPHIRVSASDADSQTIDWQSQEGESTSPLSLEDDSRSFVSELTIRPARRPEDTQQSQDGPREIVDGRTEPCDVDWVPRFPISRHRSFPAIIKRKASLSGIVRGIRRIASAAHVDDIKEAASSSSDLESYLLHLESSSVQDDRAAEIDGKDQEFKGKGLSGGTISSSVSEFLRRVPSGVAGIVCGLQSSASMAHLENLSDAASTSGDIQLVYPPAPDAEDPNVEGMEGAELSGQGTSGESRGPISIRISDPLIGVVSLTDFVDGLPCWPSATHIQDFYSQSPAAGPTG